jgi:hypothetical protein
MNMMVNAVALTATAAPATQALVPGPDGELVALATKMLELLPAYEGASKRVYELAEVFDARCPPKSDDLRWRLGDPVGYYTQELPNGKLVLWCSPVDIQLRRGDRQGTWHFIGSEEDQEKLSDDDFPYVDGKPQPHVIHLFKKVPSKRLQNRMNKIAAAMDAWNTAYQALEVEIGLKEAQENSSELFDPICEIVERIAQLRAQTLIGAQAKAVVLRHWHRWGKDPEDLDDQERLIAEIVDGLLSAKLAA